MNDEKYLLTQRDCANKNCESEDEDDERSSSQYFDQSLNGMLTHNGSN